MIKTVILPKVFCQTLYYKYNLRENFVDKRPKSDVPMIYDAFDITWTS